MHRGRLPIDQQLVFLRDALRRNTFLVEVLTRAVGLEMPDWYLTAGCVFQTVWNVLTDRPPAEGILDYDLFYFDATDLSYAAEDAVISAGRQVFGDLPVEVQIRNQARVHLWYEERFGVAHAGYSSTEAGIDSFPALTCCIGVRLEPDGYWRVYAPHGLADLFNLVVRPNPVLAPAEVYLAKTARWREQWPELTVLPWPGIQG
ncbi:MAG TPA: nucleotidyltransferase family protein [Pseudonocardiaceae bacterium]|jgi:hypothetical protein|nr:nucleotidyltransferase family protein [Pseudonocardiaceae bacterium]